MTCFSFLRADVHFKWTLIQVDFQLLSWKLEANLSSHPRCVTTSYLTFMVTETILDSQQRLHESVWPTSSLAHRLKLQDSFTEGKDGVTM